MASSSWALRDSSRRGQPQQREDLQQVLAGAGAQKTEAAQVVRVGMRPTVITSQLALEHWHAWLQDSTLADAIHARSAGPQASGQGRFHEKENDIRAR